MAGAPLNWKAIKSNSLFYPGRALAESRLGKWDGTAYWGHKPEHDVGFILSDNVLTEQ